MADVAEITASETRERFIELAVQNTAENHIPLDAEMVSRLTHDREPFWGHFRGLSATRIVTTSDVLWVAGHGTWRTPMASLDRQVGGLMSAGLFDELVEHVDQDVARTAPVEFLSGGVSPWMGASTLRAADLLVATVQLRELVQAPVMVGFRLLVEALSRGGPAGWQTALSWSHANDVVRMPVYSVYARVRLKSRQPAGRVSRDLMVERLADELPTLDAATLADVYSAVFGTAR